MLGKMDGVWAPKPSAGPHKFRECLPLCIILKNRLKYALTGKECAQICMEKHVKVDGKVRTDSSYPTGFMDIVTMEKSDDRFRLMFDTKGRFILHRINEEESKYKLCRVKAQKITNNKVPTITTHDGRTIRFPDPKIGVLDTVKLDLSTGKIVEFLKFQTGSLVMITKGRNTGRVGTLLSIERHEGSFDIVTVKDAKGRTFATRKGNVFVIGEGTKPIINLPKGKGIKKGIMEEREEAIARGERL
jgi:ribosomal protein S4E